MLHECPSHSQIHQRIDRKCPSARHFFAVHRRLSALNILFRSQIGSPYTVSVGQLFQTPETKYGKGINDVHHVVSLTVNNNRVERVTCFKLLELTFPTISGGMRMLTLCSVQKMHQDCIFASRLNVLNCQLIICCVFTN